MGQEGSNRHWTDDEISVLEERFPIESATVISNDIGRSKMAVRHKARRLGITKEENYRAKQLLESVDTPSFDDDSFSHFICGFVAGEGTFSINGSGSKDGGGRHVFQISLADVDEEIIEEIADFFGVGNVYTYDSREEHWEDVVTYQVQAIGEIANVIIPFFNEYSLRSTEKERQFEEWKESFYTQYDIDRKV